MDHGSARLLGPLDAVGRESRLESGIFAVVLAKPVIEDHLVPAARVRVALVDDDRIRVPVGEAATTDQDDVGIPDAVEIEESQVGLYPACAVAGFSVADDRLVGLLLRHR